MSEVIGQPEDHEPMSANEATPEIDPEEAARLAFDALRFAASNFGVGNFVQEPGPQETDPLEQHAPGPELQALFDQQAARRRSRSTNQQTRRRDMSRRRIK